MYLTHDTDINALKLILKDNALKSYSMLDKKAKNNSEKNRYGLGIYTSNNFVYFNCIYKIKISNKSPITLFFDAKLLYNHKFYVSTHWTSNPDNIGEWSNTVNGVIHTEYRRIYKKHYKKYNQVLQELLNINKYSQIAINNKINLDKLVIIRIDKKYTTDKNIKYIQNYVSKNYPNIIIEFCDHLLELMKK